MGIEWKAYQGRGAPPPKPEAVLLRTDATREEATLALLAAVQEGRAEELVNHLSEQARYVASLYHRLKTWEPVEDEDEPEENGDGEPDDANGDEG